MLWSTVIGVIEVSCARPDALTQRSSDPEMAAKLKACLAAAMGLARRSKRWSQFEALVTVCTQFGQRGASADDGSLEVQGGLHNNYSDGVGVPVKGEAEGDFWFAVRGVLPSKLPRRHQTAFG